MRPKNIPLASNSILDLETKALRDTRIESVDLEYVMNWNH